MHRLIKCSYHSIFYLLVIILMIVNFLTFATLTAGQEMRPEMICKDNCKSTSRTCQVTKIKDFNYTRSSSIFGFPSNMIDYNSSERSVIGSHIGANTSKV